MEQLTFFNPPALTVSEITHYMRQLLESDEILRNIWVQGEVSNLSRPGSGHIYFTLKDQTAALRCVIWKNNALRLRFSLENGRGVEAHGAFSVYEKDGQYQLYVDAIRPAGEGQLYLEFLRLKARLEAEGLFDPERKRILPSRPTRIGIVTSPTGAALQDMLNTIQQRYPLAEVFLAPTSVQGEMAPLEIVRALKWVNQINPDLIILARGGGSLEDLWAFNDENVVRAIIDSPKPVVTGIGHETDFTLADFAADMRAPTPTGAAVLVTPDINEIAGALAAYRRELVDILISDLANRRSYLADAVARLRRTSPLWIIQNDRQRLDENISRLRRAAAHSLELKRARCQGAANHLTSLNPLSILQRGYAVVSQAGGEIVKSINQVEPGQKISIRVSDGQFPAETR